MMKKYILIPVIAALVVFTSCQEKKSETKDSNTTEEVKKEPFFQIIISTMVIK